MGFEAYPGKQTWALRQFQSKINARKYSERERWKLCYSTLLISVRVEVVLFIHYSSQ